ncbi:MAG: hypothetical protein EHM25_01005 [Nitrosopumilales archaeon]|nr:MAG: hypothetical protein EHM25_12590 [Nitrosopumilales archaeon]RPJ31526.1 MAG: hypothetical protein EHM25_02515 [Nitrosopumilales archaeon]RPJ32348.1 MAG: hypothetical protein EHM25_01005 [Nitrosopumilales archaeon]
MSQPVRNYAVDDQYYPERFQASSGASNVESIASIGIHKNPRDYNSEIIWFEEAKDFSIAEMEADTIEFEREDVTSDLPIHQTNATKIGSWEINPVIMAKPTSSFLNYLKLITMNEGINNTRGTELLAYANGGFWYRKVHTYNKGLATEYIIEEVYPYMKASNWINPFSEKYTSESVYEFNLLVENHPNVYYKGLIDPMVGLPEGTKPVEITHDAVTCTATTFTISALTMTDPDFIALESTEGDLWVIVYSQLGNKTLTARHMGDGTDLVITGTFDTKVFYELYWLLTEEIKMPREGLEVAVTV